MAPYLTAQSLSKSYGSRVLFKEISLSVFAKDRIGLIGPNGAGKSTLLTILAGIEKSEGGVLSYKKDLKIGYVPQTSEFQDLTPHQILVEAQGTENHLPEYEKARLATLWLSKLQFADPNISATKLSGGWKKRLSFAKELIKSPDLILLDEPTNHLDLEGIVWLEKFLLKEVSTFILVSHDRYFLQKVAGRIIEIDPVYPSGLLSIDGSYANFLQKKGEFLEGQLTQERSLASKARRESEWLLQSPKARSTKAQSRIDNAQNVLQELSDVQARNRQKKAAISFDSSGRETRKLIISKNLGKKAGERVLFEHLDFTLTPGTRIGLMGPNGAGKTTLLRLLADELKPDQGTLKRAEALKTVYFDQHRALLPDELSLREALSPMGDFVIYKGQRVHVNGWCKRFLFSPDILDMPLGKLSGGERARISIAHLMLQPADVLLLDEPTNDLDVPTLETLEQSLMEFSGAVVLITHDRCMLDRICNQLLALGDPQHTQFYASFSQWEASCKPEQKSKKKEKERVVSSQEKQECKQIERQIAKLEKKAQELNTLLQDAEITANSERLDEVCQAVALAENEIEQLYLRWEDLDNLNSGL